MSRATLLANIEANLGVINLLYPKVVRDNGGVGDIMASLEKQQHKPLEDVYRESNAIIAYGFKDMHGEDYDTLDYAEQLSFFGSEVDNEH
jgi:hypothetical protein